MGSDKFSGDLPLLSPPLPNMAVPAPWVSVRIQVLSSQGGTPVWSVNPLSTHVSDWPSGERSVLWPIFSRGWVSS